MTVTVPAAPGAVIDIKLSEQAAAHAGPLLAQSLGSSLDRLLATQMQAMDVVKKGGPQTTGSGINVNVNKDIAFHVSGTKYESPFEIWGATDGAILANSINVSYANTITSVMTGSIKYAYYRFDGTINPFYLSGNAKNYQYSTTDTSPNSVYGNTTTRAAGNLALFPTNEVIADNNSETYLSGTLSQLTFNASKMLKAEVINGELDISASQLLTDQVSAPINPFEVQADTIGVAVSGSLSGYDASYYDGSYIRISGGTAIPVSRETSLLKILSQGELWAGNDKVSIILPDRLEQSININTSGGNDTVTATGGGGELTIDTGNGDDQITLQDDQVHLTTGDGVDTLRAAFTEVHMVDYSGLDNFVFTGKEAADITGNQLDNQITGGNFDDQIRGEQGNDVLQGLGGADNLYGGYGDDQLFGGAGNDVLTGGEGADTLWGGAGNDVYIIEDNSDIVNESRGPANAADAGGIDTVWSFVSDYALGARMENLILKGEAVSGHGNTLANIITGNDRDNTLSGEAGNDTLYGQAGNDRLDGGAGIDTMWGGAGDDTYVVDNVRDRLSEVLSANDAVDAGGNDTVESSINFTLAQGFENLVLTGKSNLNGTGNEAGNHITGNEGNNIIDGKAGTDLLNGGEGSDIYMIGNADEHGAAEFADTGAEGVDEVRFAPKQVSVAAGEMIITPRLKLFEADTGIERVVIGTGTSKLAVSSGKVAADIDASEVKNGLTIVGNTGENTLIGAGFNDTLIGNGGKDVLTGGAGSDKFVFNTAPNAKTDVDTIIDFSHGEDQLVFVRSKFANIGTVGDLAESAFYSGDSVMKAHDADDRFIFDTLNGNLYFDRDGSGSSAAVLIGVLTPGASLSATDFKIVDVI